MNYIDIVDISDYVWGDEYEYFEREIDDIVEKLTKKLDIGSVSLSWGSTLLTLYGNKSHLDEMRCKIYPVHATKRSEYSDIFVIKQTHMICKLVTGSRGKEIWVEVGDDPRPVMKNERGYDIEFRTQEEADQHILDNDLKHNIEINNLIKNFWNFLKRYTETHGCELTITCKSGSEDDAIVILGTECPWYSQDVESVVLRLQL